MKNLFKSTLIILSLTIYGYSETVSLNDCIDTHIVGHIDYSSPSIYICHISETGIYNFQVSKVDNTYLPGILLYSGYNDANSQESNYLAGSGNEVLDPVTGYTKLSFSIKLFEGNTYYLRAQSVTEAEDPDLGGIPFDGDFGLDVTQVEELSNTFFPVTDGSLENFGDTNAYPVTVTQAGTYTFYSNYTSDKVDLVGELYDVDTNTLLVSDNNSGSYNNFTLSYVLEADKQYELRVHADERTTGSYVLHVLHTPSTPVAGVKDDFNGDGIADILWRKDTGRNVIYYMNADGSHTRNVIASAPTTYSVAGVADFNGDGIADILWRKDTGKNVIYYMNADGSNTRNVIASAPSTYSVAGVADFNADGIADILWRKDTGRNVIYYMNADGSHTRNVIASVPNTYTASI